MSKEVTRTIITGYKWDVVSKENGSLNVVGTLVSPSPLRSLKAQETLLEQNNYDPKTHVLLSAGLEQKKYIMSEETFLANATEVLDKTAEEQ